MTNKGKLYLIPVAISEDSLDKIITPQMLSVLPHIKHFLTENVRTSRRFLSSLKIYPSIEELNFSVLDKDTRAEDLRDLMSPLFSGESLGVMSESGCPGVADPGSLAVAFAHEHQMTVVPLVGPSSILMALMSSGLNGQNFAFNGYLPVEKDKLSQSIRQHEKDSLSGRQTQIFIETPYRNQAIFDMLIKTLRAETRLSVAVDITGADEKILTMSVGKWKQKSFSLPKKPAVFLFLA